MTAMKAMNDEELIRQVQNGDVAAYEQIVRRYQGKLVSFITRVVGNCDDAKDIVANVLFRLYQTVDRFDASRKFSTYLFAITKNEAISFLRQQKHELPLAEDSLVADDQKFYESFISDERMTLVRKAICNIEEKYQHVINLYYFEDLSYEEISKSLHIPINTVRTHLLRGKALLKNYLISYEIT